MISKENIDIPDDVKALIDSHFNAFSFVSVGNYVYVCDIASDTSRWTKESVEYFGLPGEYMHAAGEIWLEHIHPDDRNSYLDDIKRIFSGESDTHNTQYRARNRVGNYVVCTCKGVVLRNAQNKPQYFCGAITNHGIENQIDVMTGLKNQYGFFVDINSILSNHRHSFVVMLGFSGFSNINNLYGYNYGNRVLQHASRYLESKLGDFCEIYRLDGARFGAITDEQNIDKLVNHYNNLKNEFSSFKINNNMLNLNLVGGAIKIDIFSLTNKTVYACLSYAYAFSKNQNHGKLVNFSDTISSKDPQDSLLKVNTVRRSILDGCNGFYLAYQPIINADSEKVTGAEALIRYKNERFGEVRPDEFIPIIENDSIFPTLGTWILKKAISDAKSFLEKDPNFVINVNLAYSQCEEPDFVSSVIHALDSYQFPANNLCLEITERCRLLDISLLKKIAHSLRSYGIKMALDDFGTGFSSLSVMTSIPFDVIKIDNGFIKNIINDSRIETVINAVRLIATEYGAKVTIEGIETTKIRDIVKKNGVKSMQGYLYSRPIPFEGFYDKYFA